MANDRMRMRSLPNAARDIHVTGLWLFQSAYIYYSPALFLLLIFSSPSRCFIDPSILPTISPQHELRIPCLLPPVITFYHLRCASQLSSPVLHRQGPILILRLSNLQNLHFMPWKTIHPCPVWNRFRIPVCPMFWKRCPNCSSPHL